MNAGTVLYETPRVPAWGVGAKKITSEQNYYSKLPKEMQHGPVYDHAVEAALIGQVLVNHEIPKNWDLAATDFHYGLYAVMWEKITASKGTIGYKELAAELKRDWTDFTPDEITKCVEAYANPHIKADVPIQYQIKDPTLSERGKMNADFVKNAALRREGLYYKTMIINLVYNGEWSRVIKAANYMMQKESELEAKAAKERLERRQDD